MQGAGGRHPSLLRLSRRFGLPEAEVMPPCARPPRLTRGLRRGAIDVPSSVSAHRLSRIHETATTGASWVSEEGPAVMRHFVTQLSVLLAAVALSGPAYAQQPSPEASAQPAAAEESRSPWLLVPVFSSSPKLGTSGGGLGAYMHTFDADSRVSLFGMSYQVPHPRTHRSPARLPGHPSAPTTIAP